MSGDLEKRDQALAPNEYIHVLDDTKGTISTHVGDTQVSLGGNDLPVIFDSDSKRFERVSMKEAIQLFKTAPEGWYIQLKNPTPTLKTPGRGKEGTTPDLSVGHKVNIPGPVSIPLWPGQMAKVLKGHHLRYNQFLVCRVYDVEAAKEHLKKAVIETSPGGDDPETTPETTPETELIDVSKLTVGKLFVIKGTVVSFFIPPTGIEVVADEDDKLIRSAVTLERLEYCILLDEDGNKEYKKGPDVVFPQPTEQFLRRKRGDGNITRKFRAIELNEQMGLYIKVIAEYTEDEVTYKAGDELFLTGKAVRIYYPRPEHAVMRYGEGQEINFAVAIPVGEGRYLLNKPTGDIDTIKGPKMLLPDPRTEVIVRRILTARQCELMYPDNEKAMAWNMALKGQQEEGGMDMEDFLREGQYSVSTLSNMPRGMMMSASAMVFGDVQAAIDPRQEETERGPKRSSRGRRKAPVADDFKRGTKFTPPRQLTLDTKFQGAVQICPWTGYAVQVTSKKGQRRVVVGPDAILLDYDEDLEVLQFSTGTPKSSENRMHSVYLRVKNNKVSDQVTAETKDMVDVNVMCSFRVNFEGDHEKWFDVEDYVGLLTDHIRSMIRNAVKKLTISEFYEGPIDIIRDTVLGKQDEDGERPGRNFDENGMRIYDVEVLHVNILDDAMGEMLIDSQHENVKLMLKVQQAENKLGVDKRMEEIYRESAGAIQETAEHQHGIRMLNEQAALELAKAKVSVAAGKDKAVLEADQAEQELRDSIEKAVLSRATARHDQEHANAIAHHGLMREGLDASTKNWVDKATAVQPELIAALQALGDKHLLERMAETMGPLGILGGTSITDALGNLIKGTKLEGLLTNGMAKVKETAGRIKD